MAMLPSVSRLAFNAGRSAGLRPSRSANLGSAMRQVDVNAAVATKMQKRGYASPSQVNQMATPVEVKPEVRAGRGSTQKILGNGKWTDVRSRDMFSAD